MFLPSPLMTKQQVVVAFKPAAPAMDAPFRTLKRAHAVSDGVGIQAREPSAGRLHGEVRLFCSLNWDAAVLKRLGQDELAVHAASVAKELESKWSPRLVALVKLHGVTLTSDALAGGRSGPSELREMLWSYSKQVEQRRRQDPKLRILDRYVKRLVGEVINMTGPVARVAVGDTVVLVGSDELEATGADEIGAPVTIAVEKLGATQQLTTVMPAIKDPDERERELADRYRTVVAAPIVIDDDLTAAFAELDADAGRVEARPNSGQ